MSEWWLTPGVWNGPCNVTPGDVDRARPLLMAARAKGAIAVRVGGFLGFGSQRWVFKPTCPDCAFDPRHAPTYPPCERHSKEAVA